MATPNRMGISTAIGRGILPRALLDMVERAEKDVQAMIKAAPDKAAASARERQDLYDRIKARYEQLSRELAEAVGKGARKASEEEAVRTARTMPRGAKPHPLTREQMITALDGKSVDQLVATATQSMSGNAIRHLRNAAARAFGQAAIEGLDANGTHKLLQEEWDKEAGDKAAFRFVDKRGAQWSNARYLQMLVRTTSAEVRRNTMTNTFVQNGRDLARISEDSDEAGLCEACARWEGRIVSLTGATEGFPTMEEAKADGLFHPNCTHRIEYLDEDEVEAALAERDARLGKQEPEDESGGGKPPEPPKKATGGGEEGRKQAEAEARQSIADLGNIGNRAQNITDKASADNAIAEMKAVIERAEKQEAAAQGAVREALRKALEAARKKFDDVRADALDNFGGSAKEVTWARMHKLGIKQGGTPMPFKQEGDEQGRSSVNPHYREPGQNGFRAAYTANCQRVVAAEELRQRGYRVEAKPRIEKIEKNGVVVQSDSLPYDNRWMDAFEGGRQNAVYDIPVGRESKNHVRGWKAKKRIELLMLQAGDGARGIVRVGWKGRDGGHVFNVRNERGRIIFYDAQSGSENAELNFAMANQERCHFLRVDNLPVSKTIGDYVLAKS